MAAPPFATQNSDSLTDEEHEKNYQKFLDLLSTLPKERGWRSKHLHHYQGFWYSTTFLQGVITLQPYFKAQPTDLLLVSYPKSGTTWLKALLFSLINRAHYDKQTHPLLTTNPHDCVPFLELYAINNPKNPTPDVPVMATHIPYSSLPESVLLSGCLIVYVHRNPKDVLVSLWHFACKNKFEDMEDLSLEEAFELFSKGVSPYGSFWDHVLGYWKASLESPDKVYFLKYEEMKSEPLAQARRLAEFIGHPFSPNEDREGVVQKIVELCSFENLSNLEVNKTGPTQPPRKSRDVPNSNFFRRGEVGDSKNYLTAEMIKHLDQITKSKFEPFGLISGILPG